MVPDGRRLSVFVVVVALVVAVSGCVVDVRPKTPTTDVPDERTTATADGTPTENGTVTATAGATPSEPP